MQRPVPFSRLRASAGSISLLKGIDRMRDILVENTERFARGLPANNVLLWGARGMGKSSLVKAVHAGINGQSGDRLKLIEIHREEIETLPDVMALLREASAPVHPLLRRPVVRRQRRLVQVAESGAGRRHRGTARQRPLLRHLQPPPPDPARHGGERGSTAITPHEAVEEKVSLSDRFGLWLGFHKCSQDEYLEMVSGYVAHFAADRGDRVASGGAGMGDDAGGAVRPCRLAVCAGSGGTAWGRPFGRKPSRQA
jgi:uncharacterized protein